MINTSALHQWLRTYFFGRTSSSSPAKELAMADMPAIPLPPPGPLIAPLFLANSLNWLLEGLVVAQCYYYTQNFPSDPIKIRILVYGLFVLELVQTATTTHQAWWYCVTNWNNQPALLTFPWSAMTVPMMAGIIAAVVQLFYAWRIWTLSLSKATRAMAVLITLIAIAAATTAVVTGGVFQANANPIRLQELHPEFAFWIAGSFVTDVLIAGSMLWILFTARSQTSWSATTNLIGKLVVITVGTGAAIALCGALTLALFVTTRGASFQYLPAAYIWGKLYTNSVMVSLNSRKFKSPSNTAEAESYPMRVHVSRQIFQAGSQPEDPARSWTAAATVDETKSKDVSFSVKGYQESDVETAFTHAKSSTPEV